MISLPDSNNICNPRVTMTDANTTIPCQSNLHTQRYKCKLQQIEYMFEQD